MKEKIMIVGCCGSGKSTLAIQVEQITGLPLVHLDKEYYRPCWEKPSREEWEKKMLELVSNPRWILDGNYYNSIDIRLVAADTVIFLDINRFTCIYRVIKRIILPSKRHRPDMAPSCKERFDKDFIRYVWNFNKTMRPRLYDLSKKYEYINLIILRNNKEIREFLSKVRTDIVC